MIKEILCAFCFVYGVSALGRDVAKVLITLFFERN